MSVQQQAFIILESALGADRFQRLYPDGKPYLRDMAWKLASPIVDEANTYDLVEAGRRLVRHVQRCNQYELNQISIHTLTDILCNVLQTADVYYTKESGRNWLSPEDATLVAKQIRESLKL